MEDQFYRYMAEILIQEGKNISINEHLWNCKDRQDFF